MSEPGKRGDWQGMHTIARLNWPFYLAAIVLCFVSIIGLFFLTELAFKALCILVLLSCVYFLFGSLGVSHWIYDRSDLYRWSWLKRALRGANFRNVIFCHAGFDEASELLRARITPSNWQVLDHFDEAQMTEPSIQRARALFPPTLGTLPAPFDRWPLQAQTTDVVFALLAIHEFRSMAERRDWFLEAKRVLLPNGRVILVEHLRDWANFFAFGPGFLHFHSKESWQRSWEAAELRLRDEFNVTPWVRIFMLEKI